MTGSTNFEADINQQRRKCEPMLRQQLPQFHNAVLSALPTANPSFSNDF